MKFLSILAAALGCVAFGGGDETGLVTLGLDDNFFALATNGTNVFCHAEDSTAVHAGDEISFAQAKDCARADRISLTGIRIVDKKPLPDPMRLTLDELAKKEHDFRKVTVEGVADEPIEDEIDSRWVHFRLVGTNASTLVSMHRETAPADAASCRSPVDAASCRVLQRRPSFLATLPGATVRITGTNLHHMPGKRQFVGHRLIVDDPADITVIGAAPADPVDYPPLDLDANTDPQSLATLGRHSITGTVIAAWGSSHVLVGSGNGKVRIDLVKGEPLPRPGCTIKAAGIPETDVYHPILTTARIRILNASAERRLDEPMPLTADSLHVSVGGKNGFNMVHFFKPIRLEGVIRDLPAASLPFSPWILNCDGTTVTVDSSATTDFLHGVRPGSQLAVSGILIPTTDFWRPNAPFPPITGITLVPRGRQDLTVLKGPPWWTTARLLALVGLLALATIVLGIWHFLTRMNTRLRVAERTRLAVELHDSLSQNLTGIAFQIASTKAALDDNRDSVAACLDRTERMLLSSRTELKRCLWDLRCNTLEDPDFARAIRRTVEPVMGSARVAVRFPVSRRLLDDSTAHAILCILRELVANAVRHGSAKNVRIAGECHDGKLSFSVKDDGGGFDFASRPTGSEGHFGLDGIVERVQRFEGKMDVVSSADKGTRIMISEINL